MCVCVYIAACEHIVMRDLFSYAISIFNSLALHAHKCVCKFVVVRVHAGVYLMHLLYQNCIN